MPVPEYLVDTNIFLRVIVKDDPKKAADCAQVVEQIRSGRIRAFTSHLILAELVWTCLGFYQIPKGDVIRLARGVTSIHHLTLDDEFDILYALNSFEEYPVKFVDTLISSHRRIIEGSAYVLSYDTDFDRMGVHRVRTQLKVLPRRKSPLDHWREI